MKKVEDKTLAIILLIILIAIGGIVMYGKDKIPQNKLGEPNTPPQIKGPTAPPPGYETRR